jgi:hypothetical protein
MLAGQRLLDHEPQELPRARRGLEIPMPEDALELCADFFGGEVNASLPGLREARSAAGRSMGHQVTDILRLDRP